MIRLLKVDLRASVPGPSATAEMTDLLREVKLNSGHAEAHRWEPVHVNMEDDPESLPGLTDFVIALPFRMISRRFADLLRSFKCECEYLPLIVHYRERELENEYFALNSLHVVREALDIERSTIGYYDEEFRQAEDVELLILRDEAVDDAPLSYLREISNFAVSEKLAQAITDAGLIGINLLRPEEFSS